MLVHQWVGMGIISLGLIFMAIGIYGVYTNKNFYAKATVASLIDSVGFILVTFGVVCYKGFSTFSVKILFLVLLMLILNPLANHFIVRGAYTSGYLPQRENKNKF